MKAMNIKDEGIKDIIKNIMKEKSEKAEENKLNVYVSKIDKYSDLVIVNKNKNKSANMTGIEIFKYDNDCRMILKNITEKDLDMMKEDGFMDKVDLAFNAENDIRMKSELVLFRENEIRNSRFRVLPIVYGENTKTLMETYERFHVDDRPYALEYKFMDEITTNSYIKPGIYILKDDDERNSGIYDNAFRTFGGLYDYENKDDYEVGLKVIVAPCVNTDEKYGDSLAMKFFVPNELGVKTDVYRGKNYDNYTYQHMDVTIDEKGVLHDFYDTYDLNLEKVLMLKDKERERAREREEAQKKEREARERERVKELKQKETAGIHVISYDIHDKLANKLKNNAEDIADMASEELGLPDVTDNKPSVYVLKEVVNSNGKASVSVLYDNFPKGSDDAIRNAIFETLHGDDFNMTAEAYPVSESQVKDITERYNKNILIDTSQSIEDDKDVQLNESLFTEQFDRESTWNEFSM